MAEKTTDPQQEALFREVDEELRHEQFKRLWKQYGSLLIGAAVLIVVIVAGYQGWQYWQASQRAQEARAYEQAVAMAEAGQAEAAVESLAQLATQANTGHRALAHMTMADLLIEQGRRDEAVEVYRQMADDSDVDPVMRDVGRLLVVLHGMEAGDPAQLEAYAQPLTNPGHALRFSALEATALLALKQGDTQRALELFRAVGDDPQAPRSLQARANEMVIALGGREAPQEPEPAGEQPAAGQ